METQALKQLMAAYFHQDFRDVYGGVWETVEAFVTDDPEDAAGLPGEIEWVLEEFPTEQAVDLYLDSLGCEYRADPAAGGYRGWLTEIARRVAAATDAG